MVQNLIAPLPNPHPKGLPTEREKCLARTARTRHLKGFYQGSTITGGQYAGGYAVTL